MAEDRKLTLVVDARNETGTAGVPGATRKASSLRPVLKWSLVVIGVAVVMAVPPWLERRTSEFGVTSRRVIIKVGLFQRRTLELLIRQVEAISVDQSITGRMFNFGTITLTGTGGVRETFHNISNPLEFRRSIQSLSAM